MSKPSPQLIAEWNRRLFDEGLALLGSKCYIASKRMRENKDRQNARRRTQRKAP